MENALKTDEKASIMEENRINYTIWDRFIEWNEALHAVYILAWSQISAMLAFHSKIVKSSGVGLCGR